MRKIIIDKDVLVAEIEKRIKEAESMQPIFDQFWAGQISAFKGVLKIIDTLEVKDVDLEKELDFNAEVSKFIITFYKNAKIGHKLMIRRTAKYFYDLGLKAKGE